MSNTRSIHRFYGPIGRSHPRFAGPDNFVGIKREHLSGVKVSLEALQEITKNLDNIAKTHGGTFEMGQEFELDPTLNRASAGRVGFSVYFDVEQLDKPGYETVTALAKSLGIERPVIDSVMKSFVQLPPLLYVNAANAANAAKMQGS